MQNIFYDDKWYLKISFIIIEKPQAGTSWKDNEHPNHNGHICISVPAQGTLQKKWRDFKRIAGNLLGNSLF